MLYSVTKNKVLRERKQDIGQINVSNLCLLEISFYAPVRKGLKMLLIVFCFFIDLK